MRTSTVTEGGGTFFGLGAATISEDDYTHQYSEELRIASTGDGPLQWLAGGYYSGFTATSYVYSFYPDTNNGFNADFGTNNLADNHRKVDIFQYAAFGEVSYLFRRALQDYAGRAVLHLSQQLRHERQRRIGQRHECAALRRSPRTPA